MKRRKDDGKPVVPPGVTFDLPSAPNLSDPSDPSVPPPLPHVAIPKAVLDAVKEGEIVIPDPKYIQIDYAPGPGDAKLFEENNTPPKTPEPPPPDLRDFYFPTETTVHWGG